MLPCSLGLTGRDPQGGTAMEALCKSSSYVATPVKDLLCFKRKENFRLN